MAAKSHPHKAAAAAALNILHWTDGKDQGPEMKAKDPGAPEGPKAQPALDPAKKKLKKLKPADAKAFAEFKRDVVSRLTRIEQLLEQQAIMLRYPAPIYPHMVPPPNGAVPPPVPFSQPPPPRPQAFPPIPAPPLPTAPYPNLPYYPPATAPPPQAQPSSQPSAPTVSSVDEGDHKKRRLFAGMDLRDHRKVSNKRGGRGTRKTCRKCAAEGIENVLLVGHKCPYGEAKTGGSAAKGGEGGGGGVKRASDGTPLAKLDTVRLLALPEAVPPVHHAVQHVETLLGSLQNAPQSPGPNQNFFAPPPPLQQVLPSSQSGTGGKTDG